MCLFRGGATLVPVYGPGVTVREKQQCLLSTARSRRVSCSAGMTTELWVGVSAGMATELWVGVSAGMATELWVGVSAGMATELWVGVSAGMATELWVGAVSYTHLTLPTKIGV